ncbi:hypothetical protein HGM15179_021539, partial [Zosterops borbonicus]
GPPGCQPSAALPACQPQDTDQWMVRPTIDDRCVGQPVVCIHSTIKHGRRWQREDRRLAGRTF